MLVINKEISTETTKKGTLSLRVKGDDGSVKTIHSLYDPEAEAKSIVNAFKFDGKGILVVLGLGLGYHLVELARKFPEAKILVVESMPGIYELAKEHGPELDNRIKIITGLSPEEVLREIARQQMKDGFAPLSVFALSSVVSAFSSYYNPILKSLKNTISVRLWDRLKYSKFKLDKLKVVLIDTGYFLVSEVEKALKSVGHEVLRLQVGTNGNGETIISSFVEAILNFKPDFLLTMNHLGFDEDGVLTDFFKSIEMPVASWYVDSPKLIVKAFNENVSPWMSLFLWDKSYMKDMEAMGFDSVLHLPLGTDESLFKPLTARKHRKMLSKYFCDIGFVGNSMVDPVNEWMEKVNASLHPIVEKAAEDVALSGNPDGDIMKVIPERERERIKRLNKIEKMDFEAAVLWKATLLYRLSCIKKLEDIGLRIHGDNGWTNLINSKNIRLFPPLNYYKELPLFYNACKINFNATSRQMSEAVNQRVFDVPACGTFLLTDDQEALTELFNIGEEIITYKHKDEIQEHVKFYLKHPDERQRIALRGRERVLKDHTYKHRLHSMIHFMKQRYK